MHRLLRRSTGILLAAIIIAAMFLPSAAYADQIYVVRRGDTLSSLAVRYGTSMRAIMNANGIGNANFIWVGQRLRIPGAGGGGAAPSGGGTYVVRRGDNLARIAARYGTSVSALMAANGIRNANLIYVGQRLRISAKSGGGSGGGGGGAPAPTTGKWIEVDLSSQTVSAHAGNTVVRSMVVSTGISRYPTPTGTFRVYAKYPAVAMSGPGYYLPGVPHTMFFYRGYALHGTYWHNNFGHPMSHGCINLTKPDAAWLYSWTPNGTKVVIHR
jgi:lipoprotein-anchoring transpeptidase ErfK/SrfK